MTAASGEIQIVDTHGLDLSARCVMAVLWVPEDIVHEVGPAKALAIFRTDSSATVHIRTSSSILCL
jgi:hypothetical protein